MKRTYLFYCKYSYYCQGIDSAHGYFQIEGDFVDVKHATEIFVANFEKNFPDFWNAREIENRTMIRIATN